MFGNAADWPVAMRGMDSDFLGPFESSSFVCKWQIKMHFQILLRSFSDCWIVYKMKQQMVFVFSMGRIPKLTSVIWEKKNLVRNLGIPFCLGIPTSLMGDVYAGLQRERPKRDFSLPLWRAWVKQDGHLPGGH